MDSQLTPVSEVPSVAATLGYADATITRIAFPDSQVHPQQWCVLSVKRSTDSEWEVLGLLPYIEEAK